MSLENSEWPKHPKIYEINTWPWLKSLSETYEYEITLQNIPEEIIDLDFSQFDAIWLMGVWERSPEGREIALNHPDLQAEYRNALNDFKPEDVVGSPYSVHYYHVDYRIGGQDSLELFRDQLAFQDVKLLLDYVPNHTALDHLWTLEKSKIYIEGTKKEFLERTNDFFSVEDRIIAHGRDPYFPPWTDTAQINAFSKDARQKAINTILSIAKLCDGVRCDMAMLMTNKIFSRTWGNRVGPPPEKEFWIEIISAVKEKHPNFLFIAEVYWDMEWELQQQGFDFCYDKKLYDRIKNENVRTIRAHLQANWMFQRKLVRFIENHDEQRAIIALGEERSRAAAILILTLPGARLIHEGQMSGNRVKLPVQLGRRPIEEDNQYLLEFYLRLLNSVPGRKLGTGTWALCRVNPVSPDNFSNTNLISYIWQIEDQRQLTIVNFNPYPSQGHVIIKDLDYGSNDWTFTDLLAQKVYTYHGEDLNNNGLYIDLPAWNGHIFDIKKVK